jgi:uncharacterized integral membrane protein
MSTLYLLLALLFGLFTAVVAMANSEIVSVNYLFGHVRLSLVALILGSACAGALTVGSFSLFRSIQTHLKFRETHRNQDELQRRLELMEKDKMRLEAEVGRRQMEHDTSVEKQNVREDVSESEDNPEPSYGKEGA